VAFLSIPTDLALLFTFTIYTHEFIVFNVRSSYFKRPVVMHTKCVVLL